MLCSAGIAATWLLGATALAMPRFDKWDRIVDAHDRPVESIAVAAKVTASSGSPASAAPMESGSWCFDRTKGGTLTYEFDPPSSLGWIAVRLGSTPDSAPEADIEVDAVGAPKQLVTVAKPFELVEIRHGAVRAVVVHVKPGAACLWDVRLIAPKPAPYQLVIGVDGKTLTEILHAGAAAGAAFAGVSPKALARVARFPVSWSSSTTMGEEGTHTDQGEAKRPAELVKALGLPLRTLRGPAILSPLPNGFTATWNTDAERGECSRKIELGFIRDDGGYRVTSVDVSVTCDG
jgi:hypothetical protein